MKIKNEPVYKEAERRLYSGIEKLQCPFSGLERLGSEKGSNIFLGAALEGRVKHTEYNYRDKVQFLDGRITYVVEPYGGYEKDRKDAAILVIADDPRTASRYDTRLICDQFAAAGYLVVMPNVVGSCYMDGPKVPHMKNRKSDFHLDLDYQPPSPSEENLRSDKEKIEEIASALIYLKHVRQRTKIAAASYGRAKHLLQFMRNEPPQPRNLDYPLLSDGTPYKKHNHVKIDVGFCADPSVEDMRFFSPGSPELRNMRPVSIALAENSRWKLMPDGEHTSRDELFDRLDAQGIHYQITIYSYVTPRFAVWREVTSKAQLFAKRQAFVQAITFFDEHLLNGD